MDPWRDAAALHRRLAYVPGEVNLWPNLTGGEVIDLLGALRGGLDRSRRADLIERFQLDPTKKCRAYSKGNRQKVALVAAFASDVELYLLDEPTSGLDPLMAAVFQDCVREANAAGGTVLLSSHILSEVEALCDHVTIIRAGRTADSGTFEDLRHLTRTTVVVETAEPINALAWLPGVHDATIERHRAEFSVGHADLNRVLEHLVGLGVAALTTSPPTLEELFLRHYADATVTRAVSRPGACGMNSFTGTTTLIRLALRRDRFVLAAWLLVLAGLTGDVHGDGRGQPADPGRRAARDAVHGRQRRLPHAQPVLRGERRRLHDEPALRDVRPPRRRHERALRGAAHAAERGDGPGRAPRRRRRRPRREPGRGGRRGARRERSRWRRCSAWR